MGPDVTLVELRRALLKVKRQANGGVLGPDDVARCHELFEALDGWLSRGGFLPRCWAAGREAPRG